MGEEEREKAKEDYDADYEEEYDEEYEREKKKKEAKIQPAKVSYFFGPGYQDLANTIKGAWTRNITEAKEQRDEMREEGFFSFMGLVHFVAMLSVFVYGSIITAATTVVHAVVLMICFCVVYIGFGIVWGIDRIYTMFNRIRNACPNPSCQANFLLPYYACPNCGAMHTDLRPGKYGILHRKCLCGEKLPTTFFNGRGSLPAYCPVCEYPLAGNTASRQYAIPVIGGPSVGKTCIINMGLNHMIDETAKENGWDFHFLTEGEEKKFKNTMNSLNQGIRPQKTDLDALTAYQLMLQLPTEKIGRRIYIYDIAGEMFSNSGDIQRNNAYSYSDGFVFVIDPLTISRFAAEVEDDIDITSYGASSESFDDILDIMLVNLDKMFDLSSEDVVNRYLAVVINKCDIPVLQLKIGDEAARAYMQDHPNCKRFSDAKNAVCRQFLEEYEAGNFARSAESKFKEVRYFTCSALGHNNEGVAFVGQGVKEPFLWILQKIDSSIIIP